MSAAKEYLKELNTCCAYDDYGYMDYRPSDITDAYEAGQKSRDEEVNELKKELADAVDFVMEIREDRERAEKFYRSEYATKIKETALECAEIAERLEDNKSSSWLYVADVSKCIKEKFNLCEKGA